METNNLASKKSIFMAFPLDHNEKENYIIQPTTILQYEEHQDSSFSRLSNQFKEIHFLMINLNISSISLRNLRSWNI